MTMEKETQRQCIECRNTLAIESFPAFIRKGVQYHRHSCKRCVYTANNQRQKERAAADAEFAGRLRQYRKTTYERQKEQGKIDKEKSRQAQRRFDQKRRELRKTDILLDAKIRQKERERSKRRFADPTNRLIRCMRQRMNDWMAGRLKNINTFELIFKSQVVADQTEFLSYLESVSPNWKELEVPSHDHYIPLSLFDITNERHMTAAWCPLNIRIIEKSENAAKQAKFIGFPPFIWNGLTWEELFPDVKAEIENKLKM